MPARRRRIGHRPRGGVERSRAGLDHHGQHVVAPGQRARQVAQNGS
jgi:hypothetical protein